MRDHLKLQAFHMADELALTIYQYTRSFPVEERFGLSSQLRRAAVSIPSNIVEGCARRSAQEYLRFLDVAFASAKEVEYQVSLAARLGYLAGTESTELAEKAAQAARTIHALRNAVARFPEPPRRNKPLAPSP